MQSWSCQGRTKIARIGCLSIMAEVLVLSQRLLLKDIIVCVENVTSSGRRILVKVTPKKYLFYYLF